MLIGHNSVTVWRVTEVYNDDLYWLLLIANLLLMAEGAYTVIKDMASITNGKTL